MISVLLLGCRFDGGGIGLHVIYMCTSRGLSHTVREYMFVCFHTDEGFSQHLLARLKGFKK